MRRSRIRFVCLFEKQNKKKKEIIIEKKQNLKKYRTPNKGLEPLTLRLKVWCSTDCAKAPAHCSTCSVFHIQDTGTNRCRCDAGWPARVQFCFCLMPTRPRQGREAGDGDDDEDAQSGTSVRYLLLNSMLCTVFRQSVASYVCQFNSCLMCYFATWWSCMNWYGSHWYVSLMHCMKLNASGTDSLVSVVHAEQAA